MIPSKWALTVESDILGSKCVCIVWEREGAGFPFPSKEKSSWGAVLLLNKSQIRSPCKGEEGRKKKKKHTHTHTHTRVEQLTNPNPRSISPLFHNAATYFSLLLLLNFQSLEWASDDNPPPSLSLSLCLSLAHCLPSPHFSFPPFLPPLLQPSSHTASSLWKVSFFFFGLGWSKLYACYIQTHFLWASVTWLTHFGATGETTLRLFYALLTNISIT